MPNVPRELEYDFFVSCARSENEGEDAGKVTALVQVVAAEYRRKHGASLRIFFDEEPATDAADRQESIFRALDRSTAILVIVSPAYFKSPSCKREWQRHFQCAHENGLADAPVVAVSVVDHSPVDWSDTQETTDDEFESLRRVPVVDCRSWWCEWKPAELSNEVQQAIRAIADALFDCLSVIPDRLTPLILPDQPSDAETDLEEPVLDRPTACSMPLEEPVTPGVEPASSAGNHRDEPIEQTENVQFTVFRPRSVPPLEWRTLLAFAHLAELPPDADLNELDPVQEVERQAKQVLGPEFQEYGKTTQDSTSDVPRQGLLVFIPTMEGIEFNPPRYEFQWVEHVHKTEFRFRASPQLEGKTARGRLSVFLGSLILAEITIQFRVDSRAGSDESRVGERATARPYRNIFASYSHADVTIVRQFEEHAKALGDRYLRDVVDLRAGQVWNDELMRLIEEADVFQLFWSHNAMRSQFVRQEWEYALSLRRPEFIRPTYWETPFPEFAQAGLPPEHLRRIHFHFIGTQLRKDDRTDGEFAFPRPAPDVSAAQPPRPSIGQKPLATPPSLSSVSRSRRRPALWLGAASAFAMVATVGLFAFRGSSGSRITPTAAPFSPPAQAGPDFQDCRENGSRALKVGNLADARRWFERAMNIAQERAQAKPNDSQTQRDWSASLESLADLALREGRIEQASAYLRTDLDIRKRLVNSTAQDAGSGRHTLDSQATLQLSEALDQGDTSLRQGKNEDARRSFQEYLATAARLAKSARP